MRSLRCKMRSEMIQTFCPKQTSWITRALFLLSFMGNDVLTVPQVIARDGCGAQTNRLRPGRYHRYVAEVNSCCVRLMILYEGSYTFAKTLEYKAKQNLKSGKEVTVIPPNEYQQRFISAMDEYFLACPGTFSILSHIGLLLTAFETDKWSRPIDDTKIISDPNLLPSVL